MGRYKKRKFVLVGYALSMRSRYFVSNDFQLTATNCQYVNPNNWDHPERSFRGHQSVCRTAISQCRSGVLRYLFPKHLESPPEVWWIKTSNWHADTLFGSSDVNTYYAACFSPPLTVLQTRSIGVSCQVLEECYSWHEAWKETLLLIIVTYWYCWYVRVKLQGAPKKRNSAFKLNWEIKTWSNKRSFISI